MPNLQKRSYYYVIKAAGDNDGHTIVTQRQTGATDFFVATNRGYNFKTEALKVADELAKKTPGNRYYVVKVIGGFLYHEPKVDSGVWG